MTRFCTIFAAAFALLAATVPARATIIPNEAAIESVDITFANSFTLTGEMSFIPPSCIVGTCGYSFPQPVSPPGLYLSGVPSFVPLGEPNGSTYNAIWFDGGTRTYNAGIYVNVANLPNNLTFADFTLGSPSENGGTVPPFLDPPYYAGVSGTVTCVSGCGVSAVPLPAALPLFVSAVLGLAAFARWRSRPAITGRLRA